MIEAKYDATREISKKVEDAIEKLATVDGGVVAFSFKYKDAIISASVMKSGMTDEDYATAEAGLANALSNLPLALKESSSKLVDKYLGSSNA